MTSIMIKQSIILCICFVFQISLLAQVGIKDDLTTPAPSAMLDVQSTDKGILIPRMTTTQRIAIDPVANGLMVYDTETASFWFYNVNTWQEVGVDNLGNHIATQGLNLNGNYLSGDGDSEGIFVDGNGKVGVGLDIPQTNLEVEDTIPEIRLTDGRANSGGVIGEELGKLSWYTRDVSNPNDYHPVAGIEVVAENSTVAPDGRFLFRTGINGEGLNTKMVISNEGKVGIGTTNPTTPLSILGNGATQPVSITQNQVGSVTTLELTTTDLDGDQATRLLFRGGSDDASAEFYSGARGSETQTMIIQSNGN